MTHLTINKRIAIAGGGIAGLSAAIAFRKAGFDVKVFEGAPQFKAVGAGLGLAPNAIKAFRKLGIEEEIVRAGRQLPYFKILNQKGDVLSNNDSYLLSERYGLDNLSIHRGALQHVLLSQLTANAVVTGARITGMNRKQETIILNFADGSVHETDYLVIADGVNSILRNIVAPEATLRYAGYTCWRGVVSNSSIGVAGAFETWGAAGRFGMIPLAGDQLYWFACVNAPKDDPGLRQWKVKDLVAHFSEFHQPVADVLGLTLDSQLLHNDLYDLKPLTHFAYDNILLIGDAAHATTPNMGQGACQAIEDAAVLLDELTNHTDISKAFISVEKRRLGRTAYITSQSRKVGRIAQLTNPILIGIRNLALRHSPERLKYSQFDKLYSVDFDTR